MTKKKETLIYTVITSVAFLALSYFEYNCLSNSATGLPQSISEALVKSLAIDNLKKLWKTSCIVILYAYMRLQRLQKIQ